MVTFVWAMSENYDDQFSTEVTRKEMKNLNNLYLVPLSDELKKKKVTA